MSYWTIETGKNRIKIRGIVKKAEGNHLISYLDDLFVSLLGSESDSTKIDDAYCIHFVIAHSKTTDSDILVTLYNSCSKEKVMEMEGKTIQFMVDFSSNFKTEVRSQNLPRRIKFSTKKSLLQVQKWIISH